MDYSKPTLGFRDGEEPERLNVTYSRYLGKEQGYVFLSSTELETHIACQYNCDYLANPHARKWYLGLRHSHTVSVDFHIYELKCPTAWLQGNETAYTCNLRVDIEPTEYFHIIQRTELSKEFALDIFEKAVHFMKENKRKISKQHWIFAYTQIIDDPDSVEFHIFNKLQ